MKLRVYAVLDKAVQAFLNPMIFRSEGEALRSFRDAVVQQPQFGSHKEDYAFCFLGYYDDNLGTFESFSPVVALEAATCLATPEPPIVNRDGMNGLGKAILEGFEQRTEVLKS